MTASTAKQRVLAAIESLPADAGLADAIECLVFLARIDDGLAQLDAGERSAHEEVKRRFGA